MANPASQTQTEVGHEAGGQPAFPPFDPTTFPSQLFWLAITFGALYYYMSKKILPQVGKVIEARRAMIAADIDEATKLQQKADEAAAGHAKALADARAKAQALAQATRDQLATEADAKRKTLEGELAAKLAAAEAQIAATRADAMANVSAIAEDTTGAIVERLIGRNVDQAVIASAVAAAKTN
ncbi:MAG: F0F1 ATP synthase subunit B [Roseiarcus sp.]